MQTYYATDRASFKINGRTFGVEIVSASWTLTNNATPQPTMTSSRRTEVVVLGNVGGSITITEIILQGNTLIDWSTQDFTNAVFLIQPASDTFNAPRNTVQYDGQQRILYLLAMSDGSEQWGGAGSAATRTTTFLISGWDYA